MPVPSSSAAHDAPEVSLTQPDFVHMPSWLRSAVWAAPLVLSLLFAAGVLAWAARSDRDKREELREAMISDALSLDAQLRSRLAEEQSQLANLARALPAHVEDATETLQRRPEVVAGIARGWLSLTWLDARNRILADVPSDTGARSDRRQLLSASAQEGLSMHVTAAAQEGETLVARYSPLVLLQRGVPWWLGSRYVVELVDGMDQVIATSGDGGSRPLGDAYRLGFGDGLPDVYLQLTQREPFPPWLRPLPAVMMAGFLLLVAVASWLLRRQVRNVASAEARWRREARWRGAMEDSALVGLRARDNDGRVLYVNRTFCEMVGYTREELTGCAAPMPYWPADSLEEVHTRLRRTLAGDAPRTGYEARWQHRDGHSVDATVFESPLVGADGVQIGWMGSVIDVTERKQLEERERRHAEKMVHHARLTMLGEVASTLAHELNQPLMAISSYNTGIGNSLARHNYQDATVLQALERQGEQARYAGRIVQRIRGFLTRHEPQVEACDLNTVIETAVVLLQRELRQHGVEVECSLDPALPAVAADTVLIEQVVINLVRNARDAIAGSAQTGWIKVSSTVVAPHVMSRGFVRVDVLDNGPGLGALQVDKLCEPFYSTRREGMGMGLAICRSIVEVHQGALDAANAPGGGARFSFTLPLASAHVAGDPTPHQPQEGAVA